MAESETAANEVEDAVKYVILATIASVAFGAGVWAFRGAEDGFAWFAAYLLEESLSVDNLFVFSLIFTYFQTPTIAQPKVLRYGLLAAVVLRAIFIFAGLAVVQRFEIALLPCALILFYSAYGIVAGSDEEEDLSQNAIVQFTRKTIPFTDCYDCDNFFTKDANGKSVATPLLLALICVELSDVVFAVDSVPAVFGVTTDPIIAFTSNAFAILGLRQLYTLIAEAVESFEYLKYGIAFVLAFIGAKLLAGFADVEVSTALSLGVVVISLAGGIGASLLLPQPEVADSDLADGDSVKSDTEGATGASDSAAPVGKAEEGRGVSSD